MSIEDAAMSAASLRFRAVMMTGLSFLLGVVPLVVATGAGAAARRSIGMSVFGGTLVSVILGTIMIPGFYVVMEKIKEYFKLNKENIKKEIVLKAKRLIKAEK